MKNLGTPRPFAVVGGLLMIVGLLSTPPIFADESLECLVSQFAKIKQGLDLAPVPLHLEGKSILLVGLGSYIVNAQGACNDCHTNPPFAAAGNPFQGEPEQINTAAYLAGGADFGPFMSRNLTPCTDGKPAGLTFGEFLQVMRTGVDLKEGQIDPPDTPVLQVMPWPVYSKMTDCELRAIYEFLRAIPPHDDAGCTPGGS